MSSALVVLGWVLGIATALYASEKLVHYLTELGAEIHISPGLLGVLVALGADAPEVTSALIATARGSSDVGLGVILGSNIYNLAALLGLSAIIAYRIRTTPYGLAVDGGMNMLITLVLVLLLLASGLHVLLGATLLLLLLVDVLGHTVAQERILERLPSAMRRLLPGGKVQETPAPRTPPRRVVVTCGLILLTAVFIVIGSDVLVNTSLTLGSRIGLPSAVIGTLVLAIATSLPNTWAAISLARRGLGASAITTTFSSNSINAGLGAGLPALVAALHLSTGVGTLEGVWLLAMTAGAIALAATGWAVTRREGGVLLASYAAFVVVFLLSLHSRA